MASTSAAPASLAFVSADRMAPYLHAAAGDQAAAWRLYVWNRDLSAAFLADIAILEVALRNATNDQLVAVFGSSWFAQDIGIDDRSRNTLNRAWESIPATRRKTGWLVAQLMFGFWTGLLDSGGWAGRAPQRWPMDHENLWRSCLHTAFPGGRIEARRHGGNFTRSSTHDLVSKVNALRNRAAHHEPLLSGFPLPGRANTKGAPPVRLTPQDGHDVCMSLARILDRNLATWLAADSDVPAIITARP